MPLPPQNVRKAQIRGKEIRDQYEAYQRRQAGIPEVVIEPDPVTNEPKEWTRVDQGEYWLIRDPEGKTYQVLKDPDTGARIEDFLDQHLTWGNIFKLGLVGLGAAIFAGGVKVQREVSNGKAKD